MIDVEHPETIPSGIQEAVFEYIEKLPAELLSEIKNHNIDNFFDVFCAIEHYVGIYKTPELYSRVISCLLQNSIRCFHATKVLNEHDVRKKGLIVNDWNRYSATLETALRTSEIPEDKILAAMQSVQHEYDRKYKGMQPQVYFFAPMSSAYSEDGAGYDQFCQNVGGELARWALKDNMPDVYLVLKNMGKAIVVEFELPFSSIENYDVNSIAFQFIAYYAGILLWGKKFQVEFDNKTYLDIAPSQIVQIHEYDRSIDYE